MHDPSNAESIAIVVSIFYIGIGACVVATVADMGYDKGKALGVGVFWPIAFVIVAIKGFIDWVIGLWQ